VVERAVLPEDLNLAQEVFLTGTAAEVTPVAEIDEHRFQDGRMTRALMADFDAAVRP
jgi:branched-chain amino acid aminotransferase